MTTGARGREKGATLSALYTRFSEHFQGIRLRADGGTNGFVDHQSDGDIPRMVRRRIACCLYRGVGRELQEGQGGVKVA